MAMLRRLRSDQRGFTIIEVLIASVLLIVGLFGVVSMIDAANATDTTTKAREQGVGLARELVEAGRSIGYAQLTPSTVVPQVQAMPGLGNANAGPGWTIVRRGVVYTVAMGACAIDDPSDGVGTEDPTQFCASQSGVPSLPCASLLSVGIKGSASVLGSLSGTAAGQATIGLCGIDANLDGRIDNITQADVSLCAGAVCAAVPPIPPLPTDATPDDYKRIEAVVTWSVGGGSRYVLLSTAESNPGVPAGPHMSNLSGTQGLAQVNFTVASDPNAVAVQWAVNGTPQGSATSTGSNSWSFNWNIGLVSPTSLLPGLGEVLDGNYTISATAFDANGNPGPPISTTVPLNRRQPYAPAYFAGGHDGSIVDFQWAASKEGDISGYRVYRIVSGGSNVLVCSTSNAHATTCSDSNPPAGALIQYYVVAVDTSPPPNPAPREGDHSTTLNVTTSNLPPNPPTSLQTSVSGGNTVLAWQAPVPADSEFPIPDAIDFYRIYRDGQAIANRYDTATGPAVGTVSYTDTNTGGVQHTYWVTAVDPQLAESTAAGPVTR